MVSKILSVILTCTVVIYIRINVVPGVNNRAFNKPPKTIFLFDYYLVKISNPHGKACFANRLKALKISLKKKPHVPQCELDGEYAPLQCNVYTGVCWCVDKRGKELVGSRTKRTPNCCK